VEKLILVTFRSIVIVAMVSAWVGFCLGIYLGVQGIHG
jgi:hypothetical protein